MTRTQGFTLIELLIVCAIIGILTVIGVVSFRAAIDRSRLSEASTQVATALQRARSASQRYDQNASFVTKSTTTTSYTLSINGQNFSYSLPVGTQLKTSAVVNLAYSAPFGEVNTTVPTNLTISLQKNAAQIRTIRVLGVTGKVYLQ